MAKLRRKVKLLGGRRGRPRKNKGRFFFTGSSGCSNISKNYYHFLQIIQPAQAFKPNVISTPQPTLRSQKRFEMEASFLSPINNNNGPSKESGRLTRARSLQLWSEIKEKPLEIKLEPVDEDSMDTIPHQTEPLDEDSMDTIPEQTEPSQFVINEYNASLVRRSLSLMRISPVEDIYMDTDEFDTEDSEMDSLWEINPFDTIVFRRRNQSLDNTITRAVEENSLRNDVKKRRPLPDQSVFDQVSSEYAQAKSKFKESPKKPTRKPKVQKFKYPWEELSQQFEPDESYSLKTLRLKKTDKRKAEPLETPSRLRRKQIALSEVTEESLMIAQKIEESRMSRSRDEGFNETSDFDVKYVPNNSRYPFRKRRYLRAWWINSGRNNLRYEHTQYTRADIRAKKAIEKIQKESKIQTKSLIGNTIVQNPPAVMLEIAKELQKEKKRLTCDQSKKKSSIGSNQTNAESANLFSSKEVAKAFVLRSADKGVQIIEQHEGFGMKLKSECLKF